MAEENNPNYRINLEIFEGPLDLLLHLIKKDDLDIMDIPISRLLDEYLSYLTLAKELNIDFAGDFILMASELTNIKSRTLLPDEKGQEEEGPDPRDELMKKLLEYQRYKEAAKELTQRDLLGRDVFHRSLEGPPSTTGVETIQVDTMSLLLSFQGILKRMPGDKAHEITIDRGVSISERIVQMMEQIRGQKQISFESIFEGDKTRQDLIVSFLAILEMAKMGMVDIVQGETYDSIFLIPHLIEEGTEIVEKENQDGTTETAH